MVLQEWAPSVGEGNMQGQTEEAALHSVLLDCIGQLSKGLEDRQHLVEAMARVACKIGQTPLPTSHGILQCLAAAAQALSTLPDQVCKLFKS